MSLNLKAEQFVKCTPSQVYFGFTHAISLMEWMCDFATVVPHPGGRIYLWWRGDFYSAGEFISLAENKSIVFKWHSSQDPAPSQIAVTLQEKDGGTLVGLTHTTPDGEYWSEHARSFQQEWAWTLTNLAQVLETGLDKRIFDRPVLGINMSDFNEGIAKAMGVPVNAGIRLDFLPEKMGAYQAGLRKDDIIIELDGKSITNDLGSLLMAIQGKKGGDKVEVVFYRGPEKKTLTMELTKRPAPQIPWEPEELAKAIRAKYDEGLAALEKACANGSEVDADQELAPDEWSAKEVLAHLIQSERHWLENLEDVIGGYPRLSDDWAGNSTQHVHATAAAYKTVQGLLEEMKRLSDEMVAYVSSLPAEFTARKASYFQAAIMLLEGSLPHILSHIDQIQNAIAAAKKKARNSTGDG
ncbi:MAG: SRPBCC domain-containing protein [Anaerolineales bacterium]